jgi:Kef-type K+ transport system membrane component KefB
MRLKPNLLLNRNVLLVFFLGLSYLFFILADEGLVEGLTENISHPVSLLLLQITIIVILARLFSIVLKRLGQPAVVGEILVGIALGPSLVGQLFPEFSQFIFPQKSLAGLQYASQLGLVLFMFVIGLELDTQSLFRQAREAAAVSLMSLVIPFGFGVVLAYFIFEGFAGQNTTLKAFALFMGVSMSVTAFPVLARIVQERNLTKKLVGVISLASAAIGDVVAWCLLAVIIAVAKADGLASSLLTIGLSVVFVAVMFLLVQPLLSKIAEISPSKEQINRPVVVGVFLVLLISAWVSEVIGIHALFGAFMAGLVMPQQHHFKRIFTEKVEDVSQVLLLPLFFVITGLRTQVGLLNTGELWLICGAVVAVAIGGKFVGAVVAGRLSGYAWADTFKIGALMNSRGLMELVILNIGYDMGVLGDEIFAMLVVMAILTTLMTGPLLDLIDFIWDSTPKVKSKPRILMSFARPEMGSRILRLAYLLTKNQHDSIEYTSLHISPRYDVSPIEANIFEQESFAFVREEAARLGVEPTTIYMATEDVTGAISDFVTDFQPDLLLLGSAKGLFDDDLLGGKIATILSQTPGDAAVFHDNGLSELRRVLVIYYDQSDDILLEYAAMFCQKENLSTTVINLSEYEIAGPVPFALEQKTILSSEFVSGFDLMLVNRNKWKAILSSGSQWIAQGPSLLIIKAGQLKNSLLKA